MSGRPKCPQPFTLPLVRISISQYTTLSYRTSFSTPYSKLMLLLLFSCWVVSDSLWSHERTLQAPVCSTISWSLLRCVSIKLVMLSNHHIPSDPFFFCLQSFPATGSFLVNWLFALGSQSIEASATVLQMNIQGWFSLGLTGLISLQSMVLWRVFSSTQFESINSLALSLLYGSTFTSICDYWKTITLKDTWSLEGKQWQT